MQVIWRIGTGGNFVAGSQMRVFLRSHKEGIPKDYYVPAKKTLTKGSQTVGKKKANSIYERRLLCFVTFKERPTGLVLSVE